MQVSFDMTKPYYAPAETNVDGIVSYQRKIWDNRIDWKVKLDVTNLYKARDLIPVGAATGTDFHRPPRS